MIRREPETSGERMKSILPALVLCSLFAWAAPAAADDGAAGSAAAQPGKDSSTHDALTIGARAIPYTATAGTITLKDASGAPACSMFYVAYTADGIVNSSARPVTFFFNGGPGSSTVWLRMASFGPKRVEFATATATATAPAPYTLVDNEFSLLD